MRPLDRGDATNRLDHGTPSNQILHYLTKALILAYMNAVAAGDFTTVVAFDANLATN